MCHGSASKLLLLEYRFSFNLRISILFQVDHGSKYNAHNYTLINIHLILYYRNKLVNNVVDLIMCALTANLIDNSKLYNTVLQVGDGVECIVIFPMT